jgi:hypothetical protein
MSTLYSRRAQRLLSMDRRTGLQIPRDVADGRAQRYQQNWSDQAANDERDPIDAVTTVLDALILLGATLIAILLATIAAVAVADWLDGRWLV